MPAPAPLRTSSRRWLAGATLLLVAAGGAATWWGPARPLRAPVGIADPGLLAQWVVRAAEAGTLVAAVVTSGALLLLAHLVPADPVARHRARRQAHQGVAAWAVLVLLGLLLRDVGSGTGWTAVAVLLLLLVVDRSAAHPRGAWPGLAAALAASVVPVLQGHGGSGGEVHQAALVVHVVAALLWTGGLAALLLHVRDRPASLVTAVPRFSRVALAAYLALGGSGLLAVTATVPLTVAAWSSAYGVIVLGKVALLALLGAAGLRQRRRCLDRVLRGRPHAFVVVAVTELLLMSAAFGLAAALSRTPTGVVDSVVHGHDAAAAAAGNAWLGLVTDARPNAVVLVLLALLVAAHRRAAPSRRPASLFLAGVLVTGAATTSGLATQAHARPSALVVQLLLVLVVAPALLLAGGLDALVPPLQRRPRWLEVAAAPGQGALAVCALLLLLQHSGLASWALRSPWWHLALLLVALLCGLALWLPVLAREDLTGSAPWESGGWLLVVGLTLVVLTVRLQGGSDVLAADWFLEARLLQGVDPVADQQAAAPLAGLTSAVVIALGLYLLTPRGRRYPGVPSGQTLSSTSPRSSSAPIEP